MKYKYFFSLNNIKPQKLNPGGSRTSVTGEELSSLQNLSLAILTLGKGCSREPHWHPNANEMAYCLKGKCLMTILTSEQVRETFTLEPGEISFVPMGYIHHIANIGVEEAQFLIGFSHAYPLDIDLSTAINAMPNHALAASCGSSLGFFEGLKKEDNFDVFITPPLSQNNSTEIFFSSRFKLNLEAINPQIMSDGGTAKIASKYSLPALEDLCLFSLRMNGYAIREPHWHSNSDELNYILKGKARITILAPGKEIETLDLEAGEGSFIPKSYFHYIENISSDELHMGVFFSNSLPTDNGISTALSAYSDEELGAIFGTQSTYFKGFHRNTTDPKIVSGKFNLDG